ncbi:hypothetical protein WN944_026189 [Citrus x changshan-huyou]|uniref:Uncharacterized protein n=1 Tax=Citrus x changshan-huyou TaxID=2935761 RepID=A0AAP0LVU4_9ROSI
MSWIVAFSLTGAVSLDNRVWSHCFVAVVYLYNSSKISFNNEDALNEGCNGYRMQRNIEAVVDREMLKVGSVIPDQYTLKKL